MLEKRPWHYYGLWVVALVSLALNVAVIYILLQVRQQTGLALAQAAASLKTIQTGAIDTTVAIDHPIPVALDVPVKFDVVVPIKKTITINQTVAVPIDLPLLGTHTINVPINLAVPIDLSVTIPIDRSVPINASIPVKFDVPIHLKIAETTFGQGLGELRQLLQQQAETLGAGP